MANTRMSAKNSFQEGLILDISPENMSATSMSSALNATLLTFNGNEMVLQNDMGNGRVETAFLPEGYVPVGTCEFGDIIYIVSYNPLINKSQIGCFPSPERNISTEELGGLGQSLQSSDFQEMNGGSPTGKLKATSVKKILYDNRDMTPGDKYIIYSEDLDRNNTNLSDYGNTSHTHETFPKLVKIHVVSIEESGKIVYLDSTTRWYDNDYYLSNKGKKDNGKVDLDSYRDLLSSGYSIFSSKVSGKLALLVELEKITGFSCAWEAYSLNGEESDNTDYSIYMHYNWTTEHNDVNPDGVALLISEWSEINGTRGQYQKWSNTDKKFTLNQPINIGINLPQSSNTQRYKNGFTRHYSQESNISYSTYESIKYDKRIEAYQDAYKLNINKTSGGIPIPGEYYINCTKLYEGSYYSGTNRIYPNSINDSIVNNYFHYPIIKHFGNFTIPTKQTFNVDGEKIVKYPNINNLIYHYKIAPTMPYGILEEYAQEGYIDFSKLGKRHINLNTWKYYNYENTSTLTWGMEAYTEPNKGIQEIVFEFYDNNGFIAAYHTKDKLSYNGVFTEYLTLNESGTNYKLNNIKAFGSEPTYHKGLEVTKETAVPGFKYQHKDGGDWIDFDELGEGDYYMDNSGTLYSNCLYLVKIVIKYCNKNVLDEYIDLTSEEDAIVDYRWYWTNNMFNEYYYQEKDFANLQAILNFDVNAIYYQKNEGSLGKTVKYEGPIKEGNTIITNNEYEQLRAMVTYINQDGKSDEEGNIACKLKVGLQDDYNTFNINAKQESLSKINVTTYLGKSYLSNEPCQAVTNEEIGYIFEGVYPNNIGDDKLNNCSGKIDTELGKNLFAALGLEGGTEKEINYDSESYKKYQNMFALDFATIEGNSTSTNLNYIPNQGECPEDGINTKYIKTNLYDLEYTYGVSELNLTLSGILFSKYYPVKTTLNTNAIVVRPLLQTSEDTSKYNLEFNEGHFYFKQLGGLALGSDGDGDDQHTMRWYKKGYGSNYSWTDMGDNLGDDYQETESDFVDIFEAQFQQTHSSGSLYELFPGITPFILMREDDYGKQYRILAGKIEDGEDVSSTTSKVMKSTLNWNQYFGGSFIGNSAYLTGINNDITGINSVNSVLFFMLADKEDNIHILNTIIPVKYSGNAIQQTVKTKNIPVGDIFAILLMNLYYTEGNTKPIVYQGNGNFVKLSMHKYTFTKDVIHKLESGKNANNLLLMHDFEYSAYLQQVIEQLRKHANLTASQESKIVNSTDINIEIKSILKNCPLQIYYSYIDPQQELVMDPQYVIQCSDGNNYYSSQGFTSGRIYCENVETPGIFDRIDSVQTLKYYNLKNIVENEYGLYIGEKIQDDIIENTDFKKSFVISNGMLRCAKTNSNQANSTNSYTIAGKEEEWANIWPVYKDEVLFSAGKLN